MKMKHEENLAYDMFKQMLAGHDTEWAMLNPFEQDLARQAQSIVQEAFNEWGLAEEQYGVEREWLVKAFFDAHNADWNTRGWSEQPKKFYIFKRAEHGQLPLPFLMTFPSHKTTNVKVILVCFKDVTFKGYGDLDTAQFISLGQHPSAFLAESNTKTLVQAMQYLLNDVPRLTGRGERAEARASVHWDSAPDF
jgi:hypothetical protein